MSPRHKLRFRRCAALLALAMAATAGCTGGPGGDGRRGGAGDEPVTVKAMVLLNPADKILADKVIPEFEEAHPNINVEWEMVPYAGGYIQKALLSMANQQAPFDIIMWWDQLLPSTQQFLEPLDSYIEADDFDMDDFDPAWREPAQIDGQTYGVPFISDFWTFWYRKDLLSQAGIEVPGTTEELLDACRQLTDAQKQQYGYVMLGQRDPLQVMSWLPWLWAEDGEVFTKDWEPQMDTPKAIAAGEFWRDLAECSAPGSANYVHTDAITAFASGNGVMGNMGIGWIGAVQQQSPEIAANLAFGGRIPGTGAENHSAHGWPFVVTKASKNKEAAWEFLSYITQAESFKTVASDPTGSHVVMARQSVYSDAAVREVHPWVTDVSDVVDQIRPKFNPELGNPAGWTEVMDAIALANSQVLAGEKSPDDAYREADVALEQLMEDLGYAE